MENNDIDKVSTENLGPVWGDEPLKRSRTINRNRTTTTVYTTLGKIKGSIKRLENGRNVFTFKKIPYAEPPIGNLRFAKPQPVKPWKNTLDVSSNSEAPMSIQVPALSPDSKYIIGQENCLYLNVFAPEPCLNSILWTSGNTPNIPVIIWIHGGAFCIGNNDSKIYGPEILLKNDVVLVTINYR